MYDNVKTIYNIDLLNSMMLGVPYAPLSNTTLNEKHNIALGVHIPSGYPKLRYYGIGIGGISNIDNSNVNILSISRHTAEHASMYKQIPFKLVKESSDLSNIEKSKYKLRKKVIIDGKSYIAYYLKVIDDKEINSNIVRLKYKKGKDKPVITLFENKKKSILNPIPNYNKVDNMEYTDYIVKLSPITIPITVNEIKEITENIKLLGYKSETITEIALCSGYEVTFNGYKELVGTQIMYHITTGYNLQEQIADNEDIILSTDIGGVEPLISYSDV